MVEPLPPCSPSPLLLPLFLSSLLFLLPPSRAEAASNSSASLGSNATVTLSSNSTKSLAQNPTVSLALSLGLSQELNPNPFINPRPTLSLSLSLSVSEEIRANPFDFISIPPPQPEEQAQQQEPGQRVEEHRQLEEGAASQAKTSGVGRGKCAYTVTIKTSCSSPRVTRDAISLTFGDANHNEVYAARMDDPASGTFERCSIDTFRVVGPCGGRTCYLYLRRSGRDGWTPQSTKVFYRTGDSRAAVTFAFDAPLPDGVWYGFNLCHDGTPTGNGNGNSSAVLAARPTGQKDDDKGNGDDDAGGNNDDDDGGDPTIKVKTKVSGSIKTIIFKI